MKNIDEFAGHSNESPAKLLLYLHPEDGDGKAMACVNAWARELGPMVEIIDARVAWHLDEEQRKTA